MPSNDPFMPASWNFVKNPENVTKREEIGLIAIALDLIEIFE
jgi:hypothetical protein